MTFLESSAVFIRTNWPATDTASVSLAETNVPLITSGLAILVASARRFFFASGAKPSQMFDPCDRLKP